MKTNLSKSEKPNGNKISIIKIIKPTPRKYEGLLVTKFIKVGGIQIY